MQDVELFMSVFIIAEIGINHNGDIEIAKKLIDIAASVNCNAVKFQKRTPEICVSKEQRDIIRDTPWGLMTYMEYRDRVEFGKKEYSTIDQYCKKKGVEWFASAWDIESQSFLNQYDCKYNKIASAMLTNIPLLEMVAKEKKHTFISTGMSTMEEIKRAVEIFKKYDCHFELMHCNSSYPIKNEEANLRCIHTLREIFHCNVGYSGHEKGTQISLGAVVLGATSLERHITIDRTMYGSDQAASLEPRGFAILVRDIRIIEKALGDGIKIVYDSEIPIRKKLRGKHTS